MNNSSMSGSRKVRQIWYMAHPFRFQPERPGRHRKLDMKVLKKENGTIATSLGIASQHWYICNTDSSTLRKLWGVSVPVRGRFNFLLHLIYVWVWETIPLENGPLESNLPNQTKRQSNHTSSDSKEPSPVLVQPRPCSGFWDTSIEIKCEQIQKLAAKQIAKTEMLQKECLCQKRFPHFCRGMLLLIGRFEFCRRVGQLQVKHVVGPKLFFLSAW